MRTFKKLGAVGCSLLILAGCATTRLSRRPPERTMDVLNPGTPRGRVIAEFGAPAATAEKDGEKLDSFTFDPGVSGLAKFGRGFFHIAADVFTLFLWELVAWPAEVVASDQRTKVDVGYDANDRVKTVTYYK
jgi:hypothetical protein